MIASWNCSECTAPYAGHGRGGCKDYPGLKDPVRPEACSGFCCECPGFADPKHGESLDDTCRLAHCYHCGWEGAFPPVAPAAGWRPPAGWKP